MKNTGNASLAASAEEFRHSSPGFNHPKMPGRINQHSLRAAFLPVR
jgi:hypothetical protein